jgi:hypothetical protein
VNRFLSKGDCSLDEGSAAPESPGGRWRHIVESAHFWDFIVRIGVAIWIVASALIALLIRAYDTFGIGWTVLLAVLLANVGIWVASAIKLKMSGGQKILYSTSAGLIVLFVFMAEYLPHWIDKSDPHSAHTSSARTSEVHDDAMTSVSSTVANSHQPSTPQPTATPVNPTAALTPHEVQAKIDAWNSVDVPLGDLGQTISDGYALLERWPHDLKESRKKLTQAVARLRDGAEAFDRQVDRLRGNIVYPDIEKELSTAPIPLLGETAEDVLLAVGALPEELPANSELKMKPQFNDLKQALDKAKTWQSEMQRSSVATRQELSRAK